MWGFRKVDIRMSYVLRCAARNMLHLMLFLVNTGTCLFLKMLSSKVSIPGQRGSGGVTE